MLNSKSLIHQNPFAQVAEVELHYKSNVKSTDRAKVSHSRQAYEAFLQVYDPGVIEHKEFFYAMYLSRANRVLGVLKIGEGGLTATVADVRNIFQGALKTNASSVIICHNHPSGNLYPSEVDKILTRRIKEAGTILDIQLRDHIIISPDNAYYSFADEGMI